MKRAPLGLVVVLAALGCVSGCRLIFGPRNAGEARARAVAARDAARAAAEARDVKGAVRAADKAEAMVVAAARLEPCRSESLPLDPICAEIRQAAREARDHAELAREQERRREIVSSLKAKAYRATRGLAVRAVFEPLALAAEQAERSGIDALPQSIRDSALEACALTGVSAGQRCDWAAAARMARELGASQQDLSFLLALGFAMTQHAQLALVEVDTLECGAKRSITWKSEADCVWVVGVVRAAILFQNDLPRLADRELEQLTTAAASEELTLGSKRSVGLIHFAWAGMLFQEGKLLEADAHLARAIHASPDDVAPFFTGERLTRDGRYEAVAGSVEQLARGTEFEPAARAIAARARRVRDGQASERIVLDRGVALELAILYLRSISSESEPARKAWRATDQAREIARQVLRYSPL
jgi:hypothetical protein